MCEFYSKQVTTTDPKTGKTTYSTAKGDKKRDCGVKSCPTHRPTQWCVYGSQVTQSFADSDHLETNTAKGKVIAR